MGKTEQQATSPVGEKSPDTAGKSVNGAPVRRDYFSLPEDRSLEAYKHWIRQITASVGGSTADDPVKDSDEVWQRDWQTFWERIDAAKRPQSEVAQE